jgi:hypothetical protein
LFAKSIALSLLLTWISMGKELNLMGQMKVILGKVTKYVSLVGLFYCEVYMTFTGRHTVKLS